MSVPLGGLDLDRSELASCELDLSLRARIKSINLPTCIESGAMDRRIRIRLASKLQKDINVERGAVHVTEEHIY